jgi:hypothetical protein
MLSAYVLYDELFLIKLVSSSQASSRTEWSYRRDI